MIPEHLCNYPLTIGHTGQYSGVPEVVSLLPHGPDITVWRWEMPRIDDQILDCIVYLYASSDDARNGFASGGTGFLVAIPSAVDPNQIYIYAITNSHVIKEGNSPVVRFNTQVGDTAVLPLTAAQWLHHPDGDDIAAAAVGSLNTAVLKFRVIPIDLLITPEIIAHQGIGPGDDVFMVGRFVGHDGRQRNLPAARFGNISMMLGEKIMHERQYLVDSFLVETRSLSGNSGSPVFVHIPPAAHRPGSNTIVMGAIGPWLLGIDWAHVSIFEKVKEKDRQTNTQQGYIVQSNSGQMAVAPAWKIRDLLNEEPFVKARSEGDAQLAESKGSNSIVLDSSIPDSVDKEAFAESLKKSDGE